MSVNTISMVSENETAIRINGTVIDFKTREARKENWEILRAKGYQTPEDKRTVYEAFP